MVGGLVGVFTHWVRPDESPHLPFFEQVCCFVSGISAAHGHGMASGAPTHTPAAMTQRIALWCACDVD